MAQIRYEHALRNEEDAYAKERDLFHAKGGDNNFSIADKQALSRLFEKAGESFIGVELPKEKQVLKAIELYQKAENYAQYPDIKKRIGHELAKLEAVKPHVSSLEGIVQSKKIPAILSISSLLASLFFVSSTLTGNVVGELSTNNSRFIGICLFACGLIFALWVLLKKEPNLVENRNKNVSLKKRT